MTAPASLPIQTPSTASDARPLAAWRVRWPWVAAVGVGLGGLVLTAAGSAVGVIAALGTDAATFVLAGFAAASALVGVAIMVASRRPLATYGFRTPRHLPAALWAAPLAVVPLITLLAGGVSASPAAMVGLGCLSVAVAFNEEVWFRGLLPATLRRLGRRTSIVGAAVIFGVLHLANAAGGKSPLYLALQVAFATLVGLVLAELVAVTGSLWLCIAWHSAYDFSSFLGGDVISTETLVGLAVECVILVAYAAFLWRRLPTLDPGDRSSAPGLAG